VAAVDTAFGDDPAQLRELRARIAELEARNAELERIVEHLKKMVFGRKSERLIDDKHPLLPFADEQPPEPPPPPHVDEAPDEELETITYQRKRGATRISESLPRERRVIELPEEQRRCSCCGEVMQPIGEEVTEQIDYVPASMKVIETARIKYACKKHEEAGITTPALPAQPIAKGMATAGLISQVVVAKYKDHLPLYRQSRIFARDGIDIAESTLCDWIKDAAGLLEPVVLSLKASILQSAVIQSDDTGILVQDRQHQNGSRRSFLWAYLGDRDEIVFDFTPGRGRDGPSQFLGDYRGYLQADAYSGYDVMFATGHIVEVGCWAHARRRFFDALETDKENATYAIAAVRRLYETEHEARERALDASARRDLRQQSSKPLLEAMHPWLQMLKLKALPKSPMGQAVGYALNQWSALSRYLDDGRLQIDNNAVERQIRSVAVGRKNWLFAGSDEGGKRAAILYSIIGSCALQGVEPWLYIKDVPQKLAERHKPELLVPRLWKTSR
jgi:transposase